jgi:hypothetical protein
MLAFVDGVVGGGEGSCDQVFDAMSKVQSSELGLWLQVSLQCTYEQLGRDSEHTSRPSHKPLHIRQKYHKYSDSTAQAPSSPGQEATEEPHSHPSSDAQVAAVH